MGHFLNNPIVCKTVNDTKDLGRTVAQCIPIDCSIALIGPLGSGKTNFVKGLAEGLGITSNITSPSFNIFNRYVGKVNLLHIDAYRLSGDFQSTDTLMLDDFLISPYCLVVEWPELLHQSLIHYYCKIYFYINNDQSRRIVVTIPNQIQQPGYAT